MRIPFPLICGFVGVSLLLLSGCSSSRLAGTGCAVVTDVACDGAFKLRYANGEAAWRRINPDDHPTATRIVAENRLRPARCVETKKGGTLTFPGGDTVIYRDLY